MSALDTIVAAPSKLRLHAAAHARARAFVQRVQATPRDDMVAIGDLDEGGYQIPERLLRPDGVRYLAGAGTDISFDVLLLAGYGGTVHTFDPVPEAAAFVRRAARHEPRLRFHPVALWSRDETLRFHGPREPGYISHSAVDMHGTPASFSCQARSVASLMAELGHEQLDLLKISAEGAEYAILRHVVEQEIPIGVVCVELAQPAPLRRALDGVRTMCDAGWSLAAVNVRPFNWKLTFVGPR